MPWTRTHGLRLAAWGKTPPGARLYLTMDYYRLLPKVQAWKSDFRDADLDGLAREMVTRDRLPSCLARFGYRPFLQRLITQEPSDTTLYILARRHGYRLHSVKRYIALTNRAADALVQATRTAPNYSHPK